VRKPSVWVAFVDDGGARPALQGIKPVQDLSGEGNPFEKLANLLKDAEFAAAGIDAPFSVPAEHVPKNSYEELLGRIRQLENAPNKPFPRGDDLVAIAQSVHVNTKSKPLRRCEKIWADKRVNTRSTLWVKPRGGAPFAVACLTLIAKSGRPCWPWTQTGTGLLGEAFPAAQLKFWDLKHDGYSGDKGLKVRSQLVEALAEKIYLTSEQANVLKSSADAFDAVVCAFAAIAVTNGQIGIDPELTEEGWIAVHR
jgi:hypothetical protein